MTRHVLAQIIYLRRPTTTNLDYGNRFLDKSFLKDRYGSGNNKYNTYIVIGVESIGMRNYTAIGVAVRSGW